MSQTNGIQKKRLMLSSSMAIFSFVLNVAIGFYTSPLIVGKLGSEVYGFSALGGNLTTYISLVTVAINSFSARYITIELQKGNVEKACKYYTSVFYSNLFLTFIMLIPIIVVLTNLDRMFDITDSIIFDVRIHWTLLFAAWGLDLIFKVLSTATFTKNRLDLNYGLSAISTLLRFALIYTLFNYSTPKLWYIGIATLLCSFFVDFGYLVVKRNIMPEVKVKWKDFDFSCLKELTLKGIWNSINGLAAQIITGLGLIITNLFVNSIQMGYYSIAQTIPTYLQSLMYTICDVFNPNLTICYANGQIDQVEDGLKFSMKFNSLILMVPLLLFFVYGRDFYFLWQNSLTPEVVNVVCKLSALIILPMISGIFVQSLITVNAITAQLKIPVFVNICIGILSITLQILFVKFTDLGVYAIAGVSSLLILLRNYCFYPIYCAKVLGLKAFTFYPTIIKGTFVSFILLLFLYLTHRLFAICTWGAFFLYGGTCGIIAEILAFFLMLNNNEKAVAIARISSKFLRSKGKKNG